MGVMSASLVSGSMGWVLGGTGGGLTSAIEIVTPLGAGSEGRMRGTEVLGFMKGGASGRLSSLLMSPSKSWNASSLCGYAWPGAAKRVDGLRDDHRNFHDCRDRAQ
eukprot:scaffold38707_cov40-Attheya_sp.AAC.1